MDVLTLTKFLKPFLTAFAISFLATPPVHATDQSIPSKLLFAQNAGDSCRIGYWLRNSKETITLTRTNKCPNNLFFAPSREIVFVPNGDHLLKMGMHPKPRIDRISLPNPGYDAWPDQPSLPEGSRQPFQDSNQTFELNKIGVLEDGALGVIMILWLPADDGYLYLFKQSDDGWTIAASRWCGRFGCKKSKGEGPFDLDHYLSTRGDKAWPESREIWHPSLVDNQFVTSRKVTQDSAPDLYRPGSTIEINLMVGQVSTTLTAYSSPSQHTDTRHTFQVDLKTGAGKSKTLSEDQCMTSLVGHYILVNEFFRGRFELTDLSTGETVLNNLNAAGWVD